MSMPKEGDKAPAFTAKDETGKSHRLSDYKGRPVVLYFYPKDDTTGCTKEACGFRDNLGALKKTGAVVLGVSRDDAKSHQTFIEKYDLNFPLLVDTDGKISEAYGTWGEKSMYGRTYMGMFRTTFLITPDATIGKVWEHVKPEGHAQEVEAALKEWAATAKAK
jgi:peroxiredoxin Q/BCP